MSSSLMFPDAEAAADALTFASRAISVDADAAIRLVAASGTLAMTTAVLAPKGLLDAMPTVLAFRVLPVDPELECDLTVPATTLAARPDDLTAIALPDTAIRAAWAGVSPPRSGWQRSDALPSATLAARAQWGMAAVAHDLPTNPGEDVVRAVRSKIWGAPDEDLGDLARGVAFAAVSMGFVLGEEQAVVYTAPGWIRVTMQRGHVLVRVPGRIGMTEVRATGR